MSDVDPSSDFNPNADTNPSPNLTHEDWIEQGLTSHSTHFRSFQRLWGDCGISQDCSRSHEDFR